MGKIKKFNLTEEVIKPLFDAGMTDREMADHIGCSVNYLERARSKHGIFRTDNNKKYVFGRPTGKKPCNDWAAKLNGRFEDHPEASKPEGTMRISRSITIDLGTQQSSLTGF